MLCKRRDREDTLRGLRRRPTSASRSHYSLPKCCPCHVTVLVQPFIDRGTSFEIGAVPSPGAQPAKRKEQDDECDDVPLVKGPVTSSHRRVSNSVLDRESLYLSASNSEPPPGGATEKGAVRETLGRADWSPPAVRLPAASTIPARRPAIGGNSNTDRSHKTVRDSAQGARSRRGTSSVATTFHLSSVGLDLAECSVVQ